MRTTKHMTIDVCATAVALLALAGTLAATTASPIARADGSNSRHIQVALQSMPSE